MGMASVVPDIPQEKTVLKKAGIVVATAAAGLLAVSPLAFAGESHKDWGHHGNAGTKVSSYENDSEGLVNVADNNINAPIQACNQDIPVNVGLVPIQTPIKDIAGAVTGALGVFGRADADTDVRNVDARSCTQAGNTGGDAASF